MQIHSVAVDGSLALRMRRLDAACEGATGRQIPTLPLLAARLAGSFIEPVLEYGLEPHRIIRLLGALGAKGRRAAAAGFCYQSLADCRH